MNYMDVCKQNGCSTVYYGVYTSNDNNNGAVNVFQDKTEALKLTKKNKKSRFKAFQFYHEAAEFALNGCENFANNSSLDGSHQNDNGQSALAEKASPFKGPKPQELVELRKAIETGNYTFVKNTIWQNPRFLVSSGDTPSILQEGSRYNALHVAAKSKNCAITELILNTITNPEFVKLLYGDDNQENAEERCRMLLDLYLNTPNKGLNETPLHFAAKHGAADVVELLVSYPHCNRTKRNKYGLTAKELNCERGEGPNVQQVKKKIEMLLEDNYYVPVLRSEDNSLPPRVGEPFSPTNTPVLNTDPLSPQMEIHAYAGPMDKKGAEQFRKIWKTPPRSLSFNSPHAKKPPEDVASMATLRFKDPVKGLERIGKKLAKYYDVCWKEYWPFLSSFVDISTEEGLQHLENHLKKRYDSLNETFEQVNKTDNASPISELCSALSACRLNDSNSLNDSGDQKSEFEPLIAVDKACQVFANRISKNIIIILCRNGENIFKVLENEIKQLELLINSYMEDCRFSEVNFKKVHSRLGSLIGRKLYDSMKQNSEESFFYEKIKSMLETVNKRNLDCFSSDDESHNPKENGRHITKPTAHRKQLACLVNKILKDLMHLINYRLVSNDEVDYVKTCWNNAEVCSCVYFVRKIKTSLSRNSSFKNISKFTNRLDGKFISKKLNFEEGDNTSIGLPTNSDLNRSNYSLLDTSSSSNDDSSSEDDFYTPPCTPSMLSDSEDEYDDAEMPKFEAYLEGDFPSKTDNAVYNALKHSNCTIDKEKYPLIYRWQHSISLFTDRERERWTTANAKNNNSITRVDSPAAKLSNDVAPKTVTGTPSKPWLRVTGANSPKALFKTYYTHL